MKTFTIKKAPQGGALHDTNDVISLLSFPKREAQAFPLVPYRLLTMGKIPLGEATRRYVFSLTRCYLARRHKKYSILLAR